MADNITDLKEKWEANKTRWEQLCDEQERLPREGFAQVFRVLSTLEKTFTPQHPYTENFTLIDEALKRTGHQDNEAFCTAFKRNNEIMIEGNRLMMENAQLNLKIEQAKQPVPEPAPESWRFLNIDIIAPKDIQPVISEIIQDNALKGEGVFANHTDIDELPDVALDEFLGVEVYNVVCSLQPYLSELRRWGVTGEVLGKDNARFLFSILKTIADCIKKNTDKPEAVKLFILECIKSFDDIPHLGLIFQILALYGLLSLLENCTLQEGDNGYNEALDLYKWIVPLLGAKLIRFIVTGGHYGNGDKKLLQPLCDYLYSTKIGKAVQDRIFKQPQETNLNTSTMITENNASTEKNTDELKMHIKPVAEKAKSNKGGAKELKFENCITVRYESQKKDIIERMHKYLDNVSAKEAAIVVIAAIKNGYIANPRKSAFYREFGKRKIDPEYYPIYLDESQSPDLWRSPKVEDMQYKLKI